MSDRSSQFSMARPAELHGVEIFYGTVTEASAMRHMHEDYRFGIAELGTWATRYRGTGAIVGPGQLQFAQPGEISGCEFRAGETAAFRCITVPARYLESANDECRSSRRSLPLFREHLVANRRAAGDFAVVHRRLMQTTSALERSALFNDLLLGLLQGFADARPARSVADPLPRAIRRARDFIEDNLAANPSLEELAALSGLSTFHFNRAFKRCTGLPPHAYQNHRRILQAKALLAKGLASSETATLLGFADQSHFIRHFKKQMGFTPESYRRGLRQ